MVNLICIPFKNSTNTECKLSFQICGNCALHTKMCVIAHKSTATGNERIFDV